MSLRVGDMNLQYIPGDDSVPQPPTGKAREVDASVFNVDFAEFSVLVLMLFQIPTAPPSHTGRHHW